MSRTTCAHCRKKLNPDRPGQKVHTECAADYILAQKAKQERLEARRKREREKSERKADRQKLEAFKTISELEEQCRRIVQKIARIRDRNDGCISCHVGPNYGGAWHGSHFRSHGGCSSLQFHLWNIHKSCAQCNHMKGGNIAEYRPRLVEKIGRERVEWLEQQPKSKKFSREYLYRFKQVMGKRLRRMEKQIA